MTIDATEHRYVNKTESAFSYTLIKLQAIFHEDPLGPVYTERQCQYCEVTSDIDSDFLKNQATGSKMVCNPIDQVWYKQWPQFYKSIIDALCKGALTTMSLVNNPGHCVEQVCLLSYGSFTLDESDSGTHTDSMKFYCQQVLDSVNSFVLFHTFTWWHHGNTLASHHCSLGLTPLWLRAACGMSFTIQSQCLVVFPSGFSSTLRRAWNCSNWNRLTRPTGLARTCSRWCKTNGFTSRSQCRTRSVWTHHYVNALNFRSLCIIKLVTLTPIPV